MVRRIILHFEVRYEPELVHTPTSREEKLHLVSFGHCLQKAAWKRAVAQLEGNGHSSPFQRPGPWTS